MIDGSIGDEPKPLKNQKYIILVQWSTHNKVVLKAWQYWISEEHVLLDIIVSSSASSNICWLSNFSSSENWLDLLDPQSILSSSDSLFYYLRLVYPLSGFELFCILLGNLGNSATWVFTFSHHLMLFVSFWRLIRAVWLHFFIFSFVSHGSRLQIQNVWKVYITNSKFLSF